MKYCILVPHYNHERQFLAFLPQLMATGLPVVVVDDGSNEQSLHQVEQAVVDESSIYLFRLRRNRGKGGAVKAGFYHARALGFTHVVQIDADGQHCVGDIQKFVDCSRANPEAIICGKPVFDDSVPKARLYGRKVTDLGGILETFSLKIKDGMCGFRVYPLAQVEAILDAFFIGSRMDFDVELLVKAVWLNIKLQFIPTKVIYPEQSVSHYNYWSDNLIMARLHGRLLGGMVLRSPKLLLDRLLRR